jgi:uncharacterized protein involved in copper resistance
MLSAGTISSDIYASNNQTTSTNHTQIQTSQAATSKAPTQTATSQKQKETLTAMAMTTCSRGKKSHEEGRKEHEVSIVKHNKLQETNKNPTHIRIANKFEAL